MQRLKDKKCCSSPVISLQRRGRAAGPAQEAPACELCPSLWHLHVHLLLHGTALPAAIQPSPPALVLVPLPH